MTELEKIERAQMYIDKLANGINPLDDTIVGDQDIINNVRLTRCLFFVSDILKQVIQNGGVFPEKKTTRKEKKLPFSLPLEQRNAFEFSDMPIAISVITKRINQLVDADKMESLKYSSITNWLLVVGMLALSNNDSRRKTKVPTPEGNQIGISSEERVGQNGPYIGVFYNKQAQHFILDNLDAILDFEKHATELKWQPWTSQQDQCLRDLHRKGVPTEEIAITLKRNNSAIYARLKKLGALEQKEI